MRFDGQQCRTAHISPSEAELIRKLFITSVLCVCGAVRREQLKFYPQKKTVEEERKRHRLCGHIFPQTFHYSKELFPVLHRMPRLFPIK